MNANRKLMRRMLVLAMTIILPPIASAVDSHEHVILLHGLCRTSRSMVRLESALGKAGYQVVNVDYPSRSAPIERLSEKAIGEAVAGCERRGATKIHFVTHSLGGILVRSYLSRHTIPNLGRTVMLAPPNQGSEVVDRLGSFWIFKRLNGPAFGELGTGSRSTPRRLGPAGCWVGVIAGSRSINWINSIWISGCDDGKVSIERTKLEGMADFMVVSASHPLIMKNRTAIRQTLAFLRDGRFERPGNREAKP